MLLPKSTFTPLLHTPPLLHPPLCIIHLRGLLPCFPRLFLPSMPVTLTESPNRLLLSTASLPPSGSWITSLFAPFSPGLGPSESPSPFTSLHLSFYIPTSGSSPLTLQLATPVPCPASFNHSYSPLRRSSLQSSIMAR